jgi:hypothetical protein
MRQHVGRNIRLSLPRRFICDLIHFARRVPSVPVERQINIASLVAARQAAQPRPSWSVIFTKAFALVAANHAELRRSYMPFPWPHLYEHSSNIASIAIERRLGDEDAVLFMHLGNPEMKSLAHWDAQLRKYREQPIEQLTSFRRTLLLCRLPRLLRRALWWLCLNVWGRKRAHFMGTFGLSTYSSLGATSLHPLTPLTYTLNYGVIDANGNVTVRLVYDHRVVDGAFIARVLHDLERVLNCEILAELRYLQAADAA